MTLYLSGLTISTNDENSSLVDEEITSYDGGNKECIELSAKWIWENKSCNDAVKFLQKSKYEGELLDTMEREIDK